MLQLQEDKHLLLDYQHYEGMSSLDQVLMEDLSACLRRQLLSQSTMGYFGRRPHPPWPYSLPITISNEGYKLRKFALSFAKVVIKSTLRRSAGNGV